MLGLQLERALEFSGAKEFVDTLPDGLDTVVGQGVGSSLSVGQKQRIAIARCFLR